MTGEALPLLAERADALALGADPGLLTNTVLDTASRRFRREARHPITPTHHRQVLPLYGQQYLALPHTPVLEVVEVLRPYETAPPRPVIGWRTHADRIDLTGIRMPGWLTQGPPDALLVHWIAGHHPIPDDVRATVAAMAARATQPAPGDVAGTPRPITITHQERQVAHHYRPDPGGLS